MAPLLAVEVRQVAPVEGEQEYRAVRPFPVTVVPARLLDGLEPR